MYFQPSNSKESRTFDAIVVGSGISGGWAAKELTEKGLKTIVLERGRNVEHVKDYPTMNDDPWDLPNGNQVPAEILQKDYPKQSRTGYTIRPSHKHFFVNDTDHPYEETQRFDWIRGYQVGGRSLVWGRQSYRWSAMDFEANAKEGVAIPWPVSYDEIAPWYDYAESFAGISGEKLGLPQLPDGKFLKPMELNCVETHLRNEIAKHYDDRVLTIGRAAHLTERLEHSPQRGTCQYRNRCMRGCPYGAYFSSQSATLPAAEKTGNLTLQPHAIVYEIIYDEDSGKAKGVKVIDAETKEQTEYYAKVIFICASAIASSWILMNSKSNRFPNGLGNDSGELGHNIMDHHFHVGARGTHDGFQDQYYTGRRPNGIYIPRFRNLNEATKQNYLRGFGYQGGADRDKWWRGNGNNEFGGEFKDGLFEPGGWNMNLLAFGECLPYHENKFTLNDDKKDQWGLPTITFDATFRENEMEMRKDMKASAAEMLEKAGFKNINTYERNHDGIGLGIHEMGTARMGADPKTSVVNKYNQVHGCPNVFVTDGSFMTSSACQNPSLTYMAFTARAADHAVKELNKQNI
ncbi:MAG: GMC family oxidoreductase [Saprospiraceae bacterium]|nr:GMC family oxidoreductase [Saprospiraceae bacterium]